MAAEVGRGRGRLTRPTRHAPRRTARHRPRRRPDRGRAQRPVRLPRDPRSRPCAAARATWPGSRRSWRPSRRSPRSSRSSSGCLARSRGRGAGGGQGARVRRGLARRVAPVPVRLVDERMTTVSAEAMLRDRGRKGGKRRAVVDQAAAVLILQHALDTERATGAAPGEILEETSMTDEYDADHETRRSWTTSPRTVDDGSSYEGGRRAAAGAAACPAASPYWSRSRSSSAASTSSSPGASTRSATSSPRPTTTRVPARQGHLRGQEGRHRRRDGPQPQGRGRGRLGRRLHRRGGANQDSNSIQAGFFPLKKEMASEDVVEILVDPSNMVKATVTIPEGLRVDDTVAILAKKTDFSKADFKKVLDNPAQLGLPDYAEGNPEGYLFPATYDFGPDATPTSMLKAMVTRWRQAADDADLEDAAAELGYTPAGADDGREPGAGRGPRRRHAEDRPGHLQPAREPRQRRHQRPAADRRHGQLRARQRARRGADPGRSTGRLAVQHLHATPACRPGRSSRPGDDAIEAAAHPADGDWLSTSPST